jgi:LPXTG-motif cell wall-anchored protein
VTISEVTAPVFSSSASTTFIEGKPSSFLVCAPAADDPVFSISGSLPAGIHLVDNGDGSARLAGTPSGAPGTYTFAITATGLGGATTQEFTLTISAATSLALTGTDPAPAGLLAGALLVAGAGGLLLGRRRLIRR